MEISEMFAYGANIVTLQEGGKFYAMTCAWATQIDYDRLIMCIGGQSETGKKMKAGSLIGISALASEQGNLASVIGSHHSESFDKKSIASYEELDGAFVVQGAKVQMVGKIIRIDHYEPSMEDNIIQVQVLNGRISQDKKFYIFRS